MDSQFPFRPLRRWYKTVWAGMSAKLLESKIFLSQECFSKLSYFTPKKWRGFSLSYQFDELILSCRGVGYYFSFFLSF